MYHAETPYPGRKDEKRDDVHHPDTPYPDRRGEKRDVTGLSGLLAELGLVYHGLAGLGIVEQDHRLEEIIDVTLQQ